MIIVTTFTVHCHDSPHAAGFVLAGPCTRRHFNHVTNLEVDHRRSSYRKKRGRCWRSWFSSR